MAGLGFECPGEAGTMTSDLDIYRTAALLIKEHGNYGAQAHAAQRIDELKVAGDQDGEIVWIKVLDAVRDLRHGQQGRTDRLGRHDPWRGLPRAPTRNGGDRMTN